jgi:hypothetical protein
MDVAVSAGITPRVNDQSRARTVTRNTFVAACLACLVAGYLVACAPGFDPLNPFVPKHDRPVLRFLQRMAKLGLWVAVFADPPPVQERAYRGHGNICHSEGW